jgi:TPR repeat protein
MTSLHQQINLLANAMLVATALSISACSENAEDRNQAEGSVQVNTAISAVPDGNIAQLQREAQEGDPDAQYNLAYIYENGLGVPKDETKALELYQQAANQGHPAAQTNLDALSKSKVNGN